MRYLSRHRRSYLPPSRRLHCCYLWTASQNSFASPRPMRTLTSHLAQIGSASRSDPQLSMLSCVAHRVCSCRPAARACLVSCEGSLYIRSFQVSCPTGLSGMSGRSGTKQVTVAFTPLRTLLVDRDVPKEDLCLPGGPSAATIAKLSKNGNVAVEVIAPICQELNVQLYDVCQITEREGTHDA